MDQHLGDGPDLEFLRESFARLRTNFTWWVNRKDPYGKGVFEGGFLGLDNIGVFDRSAALPTGGRLEQADGTAWMALFSQNMLELALMLAEHDPTTRRSCWSSSSGSSGSLPPSTRWAITPTNCGTRRKASSTTCSACRTAAGSDSRCARSWGCCRCARPRSIEADALDRFPELPRQHRQRSSSATATSWAASPTRGCPGVAGRRLLSLVNEDKLRRILSRMLDEERFLGPHGIRSISRWHLDHPYTFDVNGTQYRVQYEPAESTTGMFGGNSNWRGPVWFPVNLLIIRALLQHYLLLRRRVHGWSAPPVRATMMTLFEVAKEISDRLVATFLPDDDGRRPVYGGAELFQTDPHWRDLISFYEYFHGDNGAGLGASHQTGWTGVVAKLIQLFGHLDAGHAPARRRPSAGPPVPATGRRPRPSDGQRARADVTLAERPGRPRDLHVGVARRPEPRARAAPSRWPTCPTTCGTTWRGPGFDAVWLMGVWQRSPMGAAIARANRPMRAAHRAGASRLHRRRRGGLGVLRPRLPRRRRASAATAGSRSLGSELARRGVRLVLDFVPNHVAPDHPWVDEHPEYFVHGTDDDLARDPWSFLAVGEHVFACGRDPYFPAWPEVLQLDASAAGARAAMADLVVRLAERCDGLRCDMAMLLLDDVFRRTWGDRVGRRTDARRRPGFWPTVIGARAASPTRLPHVGRGVLGPRTGVARSRGSTPATTSGSTTASCIARRSPRCAPTSPRPVDGQRHTVRFVENHDEPRAAGLLSARRPPRGAHRRAHASRAWRCVHEGEADRRRVRVPVTLGRRPHEAPDADFRLAASTACSTPSAAACAPASGRSVTCTAGPTTAVPTGCWRGRGRRDVRHLVVVNLSDASRPTEWWTGRGPTTPADGSCSPID